VRPVGDDVGGVVEVVGAARHQAERREGDERAEPVVGFVEDAGRARSGEDQDVLDPLAGPRERHEAADEPA
jgi:hypothetical protein